MSFQNPSFLWALLLLAIPVIIHLFNFRRYKQIIFSNVEMLREIQTQSSKTRQIKKWLILATRMLALAALILAFARPYIPQSTVKAGRQLISIYLDNSESMRAEGSDGQLFENAKNTAREVIYNLPTDSEIQILDNGLSPFTNKVSSPANAIKLIDDMVITYHPNDLNAVLQKVNNKYIGEGYASQHTFAISDFQQASTTSKTMLDSGLIVNLMRTSPTALQNLSIDSVWLDEPMVKPQTPVKLKVKVVNNGTESVESSSLILKINGVQQGVESFGIQAKEQKILDMAFTTTQKGWIDGEVSITDVPVVFDNQYFFTLQAKSNINMLQIGTPSADVVKIFSNDPIFNLTSINEGSIDYATLGKFDFIIVNELHEVGSGLAEQLQQFAQNGGVVTVIPPKEIGNYTAMYSVLGLSSYGALVKKDLSVAPQDLKNPFIRDVYKKIPQNIVLPKVAQCFDLKPSANSETIFSLKDNSALLVRSRVGAGSVFQWTVPLDRGYSNLAQHELFVLAMLKMAFSKTEKQQLAYPVFSSEAIQVAGATNAEATLRLVSPNKSVLVESATARGGLRFWLNQDLNEAGIYRVQNKNQQQLAKVALNYARSESLQRFSSNEELNNRLGGATINMLTTAPAAIKSATNALRSGTPLWKFFIILCLIFLLIEILLLRFLK
jgi:hypothetical protein